jgi:hypothetical protein
LLYQQGHLRLCRSGFATFSQLLDTDSKLPILDACLRPIRPRQTEREKSVVSEIQNPQFA